MIDVVVIAFRCEQNIENLIIDLLKQKDFINIILVDNAATKKCGEILRFYSQKYGFPFIKNNSYNIRTAKQNALLKCSNEYVFFISGNDTVPDNYFKSIFDENYDIIFTGNKNIEYSYEDLIENKFSPRIYGKLFKRKLLLHKNLLNWEEKELFYRCDDDIKIIEKSIPGFVHKEFELNKKDFSNDYIEYKYFYDEYKYFEKKEKFQKLVIPQMITAGNKAYAKMITNKDKYKVELNNIKSAYICLKDDYGTKYDKRVFNKIRSGKFTENDVNARTFKITKKIKETGKKIWDKLKPVPKPKQNFNEIKVNKERKIKK